MFGIRLILILVMLSLYFNFAISKKHKNKKHHTSTTETYPVTYRSGHYSPETKNICENLVDVECPLMEKLNKREILSNETCFFNCSHTFKEGNIQAVRIKVHQMSSQVKSSVFISTKQSHLLSSWTLPIIFHDYGNDQRFTSVEEILCPPLPTKAETVFVRIESSSKSNITFSLYRAPVEIKLLTALKLTTTPVSPWYKFYEWAEGEESVLIVANSITGKDVCSLLSLQNGQCPLGTDKASIIAGDGRYQTFLEKGGMVAKRSKFPDGVFIVILPLPSDKSCTKDFEESYENKTSRSKTVELEILPHLTIGHNSGIYIAVAISIAVIVGACTGFILMMIQRNLNPQNVLFVEDGDESDLLSNEEGPDGPRVTRRAEVRGGILIGGRNETSLDQEQQQPPQQQQQGVSFNSQSQYVPVPTNEIEPNTGVRNMLHAIIDGEANVETSGGDILVRGNSIADAPPLRHSNALPVDVVNFTSDYNPRYVFWWKSVTEYVDAAPSSKLSETGFQNNLILVGIFMALPLSEVLKSYLNVFTHEGAEDQCYFNSRCITSWGVFSDFSRVFTNLGYLLCGLAYLIIVNKHRKLSWKITVQETLGVSRNYGLFRSLGVGLVIQSIMSALYHVCPNPVTLRFDMMFMYVDAVVLIIGVWGLRHGSVSQHVHSSVCMVGLSLLAVEARDWVPRTWFWSVAASVHVFLTLTITSMLSTLGTWSFSPMSMWSIWKEWKPVYRNLRNLLAEEDKSIFTPWIISKAIVLGIVPNVLMVVLGASLDFEAYVYILMVCIVNMALYVLHYVFVKKLRGEKGTAVSWICLLLSFALWIPALVFFFLHHSDSQDSASVSRSLNSDCILFNLFDSHDLWHITSSFALFFSFVGILTLDDDLARRNPQKIPVF